jgi:hypothetical protein
VDVDEGDEKSLEVDPEPEAEIDALVMSSWAGYGELGGLISNGSEVA